MQRQSYKHGFEFISGKVDVPQSGIWISTTETTLFELDYPDYRKGLGVQFYFAAGAAEASPGPQTSINIVIYEVADGGGPSEVVWRVVRLSSNAAVGCSGLYVSGISGASKARIRVAASTDSGKVRLRGPTISFNAIAYDKTLATTHQLKFSGTQTKLVANRAIERSTSFEAAIVDKVPVALALEQTATAGRLVAACSLGYVANNKQPGGGLHLRLRLYRDNKVFKYRFYKEWDDGVLAQTEIATPCGTAMIMCAADLPSIPANCALHLEWRADTDGIYLEDLLPVVNRAKYTHWIDFTGLQEAPPINGFNYLGVAIAVDAKAQPIGPSPVGAAVVTAQRPGVLQCLGCVGTVVGASGTTTKFEIVVDPAGTIAAEQYYSGTASMFACASYRPDLSQSNPHTSFLLSQSLPGDLPARSGLLAATVLLPD